jgi:hypothetical protein|tara:strand:+ start:641 stop:844 length:204 start_codon:yes stop_codon:yes gene_type:complete
MKTIETLVENNGEWRQLKIGTILRVNDKAARRFVDKKEAIFVPKSKWKEQETNKTTNKKGDINASNS